MKNSEEKSGTRYNRRLFCRFLQGFCCVSRQFKKLWAGLLAGLFMLVLPVGALANSAEPPSLTILVRGGPADLKMAVRVTDGKTLREKELELVQRPGARYYQWYDTLTPWVLENWYHMGPQVEVSLLARGEGVSLEVPLANPPTDHYAPYARLQTLDLEKGALLPGERPFWWILLKIALRVGATLLLEGLVFCWFGYREKDSWITFFVTNLLSQAFLNAILMGQGAGPYNGLAVLLLFVEPVVFLGELLLLCVFIKEKKRWVTALYSLLANLVSLALGWKLIDLFPV